MLSFTTATSQRATKTSKALFALVSMVLSVLLVISFPLSAFAIIEDPHQIKNTVDNYVANNTDKLAGLAVIAASHDEIVHEGYYGYADMDKQIPVDENTVFEWGDISEMLVWVSVLQLEEQGKLDLNTDIRIYLPADFKLPIDEAKPITLKQLMNHQGGFDTTDLRTTFVNPDNPPDLRDALQQADVVQAYKPGTVVAQSHYGPALAAYIVSRVSGIQYETYVNWYIFTPMRMYHTALNANSSDNPAVLERRKNVKCYTNNGYELGTRLRYYKLFPSYSTMGTAADLMRLARGLMNVSTEQLFEKDETYQKLFKPTLKYTTGEPRMSYGLYYMPSSDDVWYIGSNTPGMSASLEIHPATQLATVVMTNVAYDKTFVYPLPELIFGRRTYAPVTYLEDPSQWSGVYQIAATPQHGPSRLMAFFERKILFRIKAHDIYLNHLRYEQFSPGVYIHEQMLQPQSIVRVHDDLRYNAMVSFPETDAFRIPTNRFAFEASLLLGAVAAFFFSAFSILGALIRRVKARKKGVEPSTLAVPLLAAASTILIWGVLLYAGQHILSFATTESLKPFVVGSYVYAAFAAFLALVIIRQMNKERDAQTRGKVAYRVATLVSLTVMVMNLLHWGLIF